MTLSTWLLYAAAVLVLTVTPGPSVLMCVSTSINLGVRKASIASLGSTTAVVGVMVLSAQGFNRATGVVFLLAAAVLASSKRSST